MATDNTDYTTEPTDFDAIKIHTEQK